MSFAEVLSEVEHFTPEQRRELLRHVAEIEATAPKDGLYAREVDGQLLLTGPRIITQAEVEAILEDFP